MPASLEPKPLSHRQARAAGLAALPAAALGIANGWYLEAVYRYSAPLFWTLDLLHFMVVPAVCCWLLWKNAGVAPSRYGLGRIATQRGALRELLAYAGVAVAFVAGYGLLHNLAAAFSPLLWSGSAFSYQRAIPAGGAVATATLLYLALSAGLSEELVYRGLPALYLESRLAPSAFARVYPLASAAVFAAIHWEQGSQELFATFLFGLMAAWLYMKVRNLWPLVFAHALTDLLAFSGYYG
jgi:membrane protease YdiL (CAAX protease family)